MTPLVRFEVQGQSIRPERMVHTVAGRTQLMTVSRMRERIEHALLHLRCWEHQGRPAVTVSGPNWNDSPPLIEACCDALRHEVALRLGLAATSDPIPRPR